MYPSGMGELDGLLGGGFPDSSSVLVFGQTGVTKEVLAYRFIQEGAKRGEACLFVSRHPRGDVMRDMKARGIEPSDQRLTWITTLGPGRRFQADELASLSVNVKDFLREHATSRMRLVIDSLSSLLMVNASDSVYRFLVQLIQDSKRYDSCIVAMLEDDMHEPRVAASIQQIFDGVLKVAGGGEEGISSIIVEVYKMTGTNITSGDKIVLPTKMTSEGQIRHPNAKRIAILPFANFSPDPNDGYFADGMTEELISTMSKIRELSVISRTSVMQYKDRPKPATEIGRELKAGTILEGSIRKSGDRVRVTIQMIEASKDQHVWAESYDRDLQDIFSIQRDIAERVASALRVRLVSSEREDIERKPTDSIEAYQLYLKGRYLFNLQTREDSCEASLAYFKQAIALDPNCAVAYAGMSDCYHLGSHRNWFSPEEAFPIMKDSALRAIEIDPRLAEAHAALGAVYFHYDWNWKEAEKEFTRAIELKPSYELVYEMKSYLLAILGRYDESYQQANRGAELSPEYLSLWLQVGFGINRTMLPVGKIEDAISRLEKIVETSPDFPLAHDCLGFAYCRASRVEDATRELRKAVELSKGDPAFKADLALLLAYLGKKEEASSILGDLEELSHVTYLSNVQMACIYHTLGRQDEAFENLERAYKRRSVDLPDIRMMPEMGGLRSDSRWLSIERRMGLPPSKPI